MSETDSIVTQVGNQSTVADQGKIASVDGPPERGTVRDNFDIPALPAPGK